MIRIPRAHLEARVSERPVDYLEKVSAAGHWEGEFLVLTEAAWQALVFHYNPPVERPNPIASDLPPLSTRLRTFCASLAEWLRAGCKVVARSTYRRRLAICRACPASRPWLRLLRICGHCGCTTAKLWLPASRCPRSLWPS